MSLNKLVEEWVTVALAQLDAENHYRLRAARGLPEVGFALLDKLDRTLGAPVVEKESHGLVPTRAQESSGGPCGKLFGKFPPELSLCH
ncbi:MAG: CopG family transcriptional regulator [Gammaproteobacteria bacterium]|nr:CopG family transcriptional regulator [Gammaproteobacteria bacterium]